MKGTVHNWDRFDFGPGPQPKHRLYQGPFPFEEVPGWEVVMATTPSLDVVHNFGSGFITYMVDEVGVPYQDTQQLYAYLDELAAFPLGNILYIRVNWKDIQKQPGRLDPAAHWQMTFELAEKYKKRVAFRVMLSNPDIPGLAIPEFVEQKVPMVKIGTYLGRMQYEPEYNHPYFQSAFQELHELLAARYNGNPLIEFIDTAMYGFWGEGHTWPYDFTSLPDQDTACRTFLDLFDIQRRLWSKVPLVTNTQPDFSHAGNDALLDETVKTHNWIRTDTIFIENQQIDALSNRPAWCASISEVGISDGEEKNLFLDESVTLSDNVVYHVKDIGANYWSLWNWHKIAASRLKKYYAQYPSAIDHLARSIGYRVRPSWIWQFKKGDVPGLVIGFVNDGIAGVPGVLEVVVERADGTVLAYGDLDAGYPLPGKVRQALFLLPTGTVWEGLRLKAYIHVKGMKYPVCWACKQQLTDDGALILRLTRGLSFKV